MATLTRPKMEEPSELVQFGKAIFDALKAEMEATLPEQVAAAVQECIQEKIVSKILADALGQIGGIVKEMASKAVEEKFGEMQNFYIEATKGLAEAIKNQPAPQFVMPETLALKMPPPHIKVVVPEEAVKVQVETQLAQIPFELKVPDKAFHLELREGKKRKDISYNEVTGQPSSIIETPLD